MTGTDSKDIRETVYQEYKARVSGYIHSRITNPSDAEDLLSCVFLKVYRNLDRYCEEKASLSTWIYTITRNTVNDFLRKQVPKPLSEDWQVIAEEDMAEDCLLASEELDRLSDALEELGQRERDLIILHYYKEWTLKEIACRMGMSYSNAKVLHAKSLSRLKSILSE